MTGLSKCKAAVLKRDPCIQGWVLEAGAVLRRVDLQERGRYIQGGVLYIYKEDLSCRLICRGPELGLPYAYP